MRKILLLMVGIGWGAAVAALLLVGAGKTLQRQNGDVSIRLPCAVEGTCLEVLELCSYDGHFYEDGSGRQVSGVAALVIRNSGEALVEKGNVKLRQGSRELEFSFTMLPPGATVLVPEVRAKTYDAATVGACWGWARTGQLEQPLQVQEEGRSSLRFLNGQSAVVESAVIWFKDYDADLDMYIGGISYSVEVRDLQPGHSIVIPVFRYTSGKSAVVG